MEVEKPQCRAAHVPGQLATLMAVGGVGWGESTQGRMFPEEQLGGGYAI